MFLKVIRIQDSYLKEHLTELVPLTTHVENDGLNDWLSIAVEKRTPNCNLKITSYNFCGREIRERLSWEILTQSRPCIHRQDVRQG